MEPSPERKMALVTGASSGIGFATAELLSARGYRVFAGMRSPEIDPGFSASEIDGGPQSVRLDVCDDASVADCFDLVHSFGALDVLVNNAGIGMNGVTEETSIADFQRVIDTNLTGSLRCAMAALPEMRRCRSGVIVNISSFVGEVPMIGQMAYSVSKHALNAWSRCLAQEANPLGVKVRLVQSGLAHSRIFEKNTTFPESDAYQWAYDRTLSFYLSGLKECPPASEVASVAVDAIESDSEQLSWLCGWGAREMLDAASDRSDEDYAALSALSLEEYCGELSRWTGLSIEPAE